MGFGMPNTNMSTDTKISLVPINDLKRMVSGDQDELLDAIRKTVLSGWWLNGVETRSFCDQFAAYVGVSNCQGVANGTDALEIALRALTMDNERRGGEAITVANAGGYSTIALRLAGLIPAYADIDESSQLASLPSIVSLLRPETAAVVVTHLYGGVVDVVRLRQMMVEAGYGHVPILEDCAQAHGVRLQGRMAGSLGDIATFSFYPTKNLGAFGDGGAIVTSNEALAERCQMLRQYGWASKYQNQIPGGRNSRLDEVQAAILRHLLPGLEAANARRVAILDAYQAAAGKGVQLVRSMNGTVAHLAVALCDEREGLMQHLADRGIQCEVHYPILDCDQEAWRGLLCRIADGDLQVSRSSAKRIVTLPCFPGMTDQELRRVCDALSSWSV